ncbi:MAG: hypothetical protein ACP5K8_09540, partial [Nitrososphaeria archaeon]
YQYRIYSLNYIHSDICKFLLFRDRFNIVFHISQKYEIIFENFQNIFWRALFKPALMKNFYSYLLHPLFKKRILNTEKQRKNYKKYLLWKTQKILKSLYGQNVPLFLNYIFKWYKNTEIKENTLNLSYNT